MSRAGSLEERVSLHAVSDTFGAQVSLGSSGRGNSAGLSASAKVEMEALLVFDDLGLLREVSFVAGFLA